MATATLRRASTKVNPPQAATPAATPLSKTHHMAAIMAAVSKVGGECFVRDDLPDGASHRVHVNIAARIEGQADLYRQQFTADLSVGHASQRASSTGAPQEDVIAWILGHVNSATRESILAKLPEVYAANGEALPVSDHDAADAAAMLKRLRAKSTQAVRGSVSIKVNQSEVPMGLVW